MASAVDRLEPEVAEAAYATMSGPSEAFALMSIAVSLKRIADVLDETVVPKPDNKEQDNG